MGFDELFLMFSHGHLEPEANREELEQFISKVSPRFVARRLGCPVGGDYDGRYAAAPNGAFYLSLGWGFGNDQRQSRGVVIVAEQRGEPVRSGREGCLDN